MHLTFRATGIETGLILYRLGVRTNIYDTRLFHPMKILKIFVVVSLPSRHALSARAYKCDIFSIINIPTLAYLLPWADFPEGLDKRDGLVTEARIEHSRHSSTLHCQYRARGRRTQERQWDAERLQTWLSILDDICGTLLLHLIICAGSGNYHSKIVPALQNNLLLIGRYWNGGTNNRSWTERKWLYMGSLCLCASCIYVHSSQRKSFSNIWSPAHNSHGDYTIRCRFSGMRVCALYDGLNHRER